MVVVKPRLRTRLRAGRATVLASDEPEAVIPVKVARILGLYPRLLAGVRVER